MANASGPQEAGGISDDACKQLWCAVLHQAVEDAKAPEPVWQEQDWDAVAAKSKNCRITPEAARSHAWRAYSSAHAKWRSDHDYIGSRSFRQVCWLCGIDPEAAESRIRRDIARAAQMAAE